MKLSFAIACVTIASQAFAAPALTSDDWAQIKSSLSETGLFSQLKSEFHSLSHDEKKQAAARFKTLVVSTLTDEQKAAAIEIWREFVASRAEEDSSQNISEMMLVWHSWWARN